MMNVLLLQLDGKLPNIALMRIAAHHRALGDDVTFRRAQNVSALDRHLTDPDFGRVYGSLIFESSRHLGERLREVYPDAIVGGTGWDVGLRLEEVGIWTKRQDYSIYPRFQQSIGFTQRGCRLKCKFCVVPTKEGPVKEEQAIADLWRGDPYPRELILLDNDFFGQPNWDTRIEEMIAGDFKVSFNQGINARMLTDEAAQAIASVRYYDDQFKTRRIYTAWDNRRDEDRLMAGLSALVKYGVKPDHIMVYILIGYWPGEGLADWEYRRAALREFGARPYPMPFVRSKEAVGFQRWVIGAYDKAISWSDWHSAGYEPRRLHIRDSGQASLVEWEAAR